MAYGKDIFRTKYREANEGLKTVQNNYLELDHEYQMLAKRVEEAIAETKLGIQVLEETKESYPMISCDVVINRYLKPILKSLGEDKDE